MIQRIGRLCPALAVALALPAFIWFVWYPLAGYSAITLLAAQVLVLALAVVLIQWMGPTWHQIGLGGKMLLKAAIITLASFALVVLAGWLTGGRPGPEYPLFQKSYGVRAFLDNWVLTGLGEELLFSGLLFNLFRERVSAKRRWVSVAAVALVFALWHLPGNIAMGRPVASIAGRLALNAISWAFFGAAYALSGNLWLTAMAHASTDFPLSPLVTNQPVLGVVFMILMVTGAWWMGRRAPLAAGAQASGESLSDSEL